LISINTILKKEYLHSAAEAHLPPRCFVCGEGHKPHDARITSLSLIHIVENGELQHNPLQGKNKCNTKQLSHRSQRRHALHLIIEKLSALGIIKNNPSSFRLQCKGHCTAVAPFKFGGANHICEAISTFLMQGKPKRTQNNLAQILQRCVHEYTKKTAARK